MIAAIADSWIIGGLVFLVLGGISALIVMHFNVRRYVRSANGTKDVTTIEVNGQPVKVVLEKSFVTHDEYRRDVAKQVRSEEDIRGKLDKLGEQVNDNRVSAIEDAERREVELNRRLDKLGDEIKGAPGQVVALLKDTKGLL